MPPSEPQWKKDKVRADVFLPSVRVVLAQHLILVGDVVEDREQGTDLVVLRTERRSVGVRVRDAAKYLNHPVFRHELTIRYSRPSGQKTEWEKLVEGWIDLIFYGYGDFVSGELHAYRVIDCRALRAQMIRRTPPLRWKEQSNHDGSSTFRAIDSRSLAPGVEIEKWCARRPPEVA